jgi:hypothetical protein
METVKPLCRLCCCNALLNTVHAAQSATVLPSTDPTDDRVYIRTELRDAPPTVWYYRVTKERGRSRLAKSHDCCNTWETSRLTQAFNKEFAALHGARRSLPQCFLRLAPHTRCDTAGYRGMVAAVVPTLACFVVGFPLVCSWALWHGEQRTRLAAALRFLLQSTRSTWWRALWAGPLRFGKNLLVCVCSPMGGACGVVPSLMIMRGVQRGAHRRLELRPHCPAVPGVLRSAGSPTAAGARTRSRAVNSALHLGCVGDRDFTRRFYCGLTHPRATIASSWRASWCCCLGAHAPQSSPATRGRP